MKSINNLNTLNALIRDEDMASKEYAALSRGKNVPAAMKKTLMRMSRDESSHKAHLVNYKKWMVGKR